MRPALPPLPPSVADPRIGLAGTACAAAAILGLAWGPSLPPLQALILVLLAYALPVIALELVLRRAHRAPGTGLDWTRAPAPDARRVATKLAGVAAGLGAVIAGHALFRIYATADLAVPLSLLLWLGPGLVPLALGYVWWVDARQSDPQDDTWRLGAIVTGQLPLAEAATLRDHAMGWVVKGFFLPIMLVYLYRNLGDLGVLRLALTHPDPVIVVFGLTKLAIMLELTIACTGYTLTLRALDAHIRSVNPFLAAWVVTLSVYEPFNRVVTGQIFAYRDGATWVDLLHIYPALTVPWLTLILASYAFWLWATAIYGLRWSNLTHRGIVTNGPYRFTKHPDYVAKVTFFWLGFAPFLLAATPWGAVTGTAALVAVSAIYWGRARMEERHLSADPVYVAYAVAMNDRSLFAPLSRRWPWLAYVPPGGGTPRNAPDRAAVPAE